jgi:hypothetical protein
MRLEYKSIAVSNLKSGVVCTIDRPPSDRKDSYFLEVKISQNVAQQDALQPVFLDNNQAGIS